MRGDADSSATTDLLCDELAGHVLLRASVSSFEKKKACGFHHCTDNTWIPSSLTSQGF